MGNKNKPIVGITSLCLSKRIEDLLDKGQSKLAIKMLSVAFTSLKETIKAEEVLEQSVKISSKARTYSATSVSKETMCGRTGRIYYIYKYQLLAKGYCTPVLEVSLSTENMDEKEASKALAGLYAYVCGILKGEIDPKQYRS